MIQASDLAVLPETIQEEIARLNLRIREQERRLEAAEHKLTGAQSGLSPIPPGHRQSLQERQLELLLHNAPNIIVLLDERGRLVFVTSALLRATGREDARSLRGKRFPDLMTPYLGTQWMEFFKERLREVCGAGEPFRFAHEIDFRGDGTPRSYDIQIHPVINEEGLAEGALVIFHDQTELVRARDRAERANRVQSDFLITISHEIRTPMNGILGMAEALSRTGTTPRQQELLGHLRASSALLLSLISDMLDYAELEAGTVRVQENRFSLSALLDEIQERYRASIAEKGLTWQCGMQEDVPDQVCTDRHMVERILASLVENAAKYTKAGGVSLSVFPRENTLHFTVSDTGIGIREEDLPRLFRPFDPLEAVQHKQQSGTGLGLTISRRLCDLLGGEILVESTFGRGSVFTLVLPLQSGDEAATDPPDFVPFTAPLARILVVDDIELNTLVAEALLEAYGVQVRSVLGGAEALRLLEGETFDLIFLDHMMPEMDGVETARQIRRLPTPACRTPLVALTANALAGAEAFFLDNGFEDYIPKPIDGLQLNHCLLRWLPPERIKRL